MRGVTSSVQKNSSRSWRCWSTIVRCVYNISLQMYTFHFHFANAISSQLCAPSSAMWNFIPPDFRPPSDFINGHWLYHTSCCWLHGQLIWNLEAPSVYKVARHCPWPLWKRFSRDHELWRRSKPGCWIVGSVIIKCDWPQRPTCTKKLF